MLSSSGNPLINVELAKHLMQITIGNILPSYDDLGEGLDNGCVDPPTGTKKKKNLKHL